MKDCFFTLLLVIGLSVITEAQDFTAKQHTFKAERISVSNIAEQSAQPAWKTRIINLEMPKPGGDGYRSFLQSQKEIQRKKYPVKVNPSNQDNQRGGEIIPPETGQMFEGNDFNSSVPMDNSMAISNDGILMSTINSTVHIYDVNTGEELYDGHFNQFTSFQFGSPSKYDPKVTYDPVEDRFIFVFLRGNTPEHSQIICGFSQTNDPLGDWNYYPLPGNPFDNNRWSDYPAISQNSEDFFITVNFIIPGEPWQTGFDGSIIWQINKESGYTGVEELDMTLWSDITYGGSYIRNLNPVDGEHCFDDNNMYFLSNRNFALENDTIFLLEISDVLSSGDAEISASALASSDSYFLAPSARQAEGHTFDTNDSRVLGAVLFDNSIQFVQNCLDTTNGITAVYHGTIHDLNGSPQVSGNIISFPADDIDLGYPNISHIGEMGVDENTLISFVHSGPADFAGTSCVMYDSFADGYTERIVLKEGVDYVDILTGTYERWGDYSGSQPVYNLPGTVWIAGSYGEEFQVNGTWIAELSVSGAFVGTNELESTPVEALAFPNPADEFISLRLTIPNTVVANVALFDQKGSEIAVLYSDRLKEGDNLLTFNISHLKAGSYFIRVSDMNGDMITEKLVVK